MSNGSSAGRRRAAGVARRLGGLLLAVLALAGCATGRPGQVHDYELASAQTFPFYRIYWVGPDFGGISLSAVDGLSGYISSVGDSVYYGNCVQSKGIFGGGSCRLPLQVTTVGLPQPLQPGPRLPTQHHHPRVPAVVYDGGRSIELYSGHVAIDVFSDTFEHALRGSQQLYPVNAPGSNKGNLPPPVFCPGVYGSVGLEETRVLANLPGHVCQKALKEQEFQESIKRSGSTSP